MERRDEEDHAHVDQDRAPQGQTSVTQTLQGEEVENPAERDSADHERGQQLRAETELLLRIVTHQRRKDDGHEQCEQHHQADMGRHLRPCVMSNASSTTSMFSSPATIRKAFPYS